MKSQNGHKSDTAKLKTRLYNGRVLVVDDESNLLKSLVFTLRRNHFVVVGCSNSEKALKEIQNAEKNDKSFDLLITDIQLPGISGLELIEAINRKNIFLPSLVITNYGTDELASRLNSLDCRGYLDKPFSTTELLSQVAGMTQSNRKEILTKNKTISTRS